MLKGKLHKLCIMLMLLAIGNMKAFGQEHFYGSKDGRHFGDDSSLTVQDDKYGTSLWSTIEKNISVTDVVSLELNEDTARFLIGDHSFRADVEITYYSAAGVPDSLAKSLYIRYDSAKAKRFNFRSSFKFNGGYKVTTRILAVYLDGTMIYTLSPYFPKVFTLAEDIYINRIYYFNCSSPMLPMHSYDATNQRLIINWTHVTGANEYDLEYTFYDDSSYVIKHDTTNSYSDFGFLFKGNATRVTIQGCEYAFSLIYNPGRIFYRIRPIHYDSVGDRIEGAWSSDTSCVFRYYKNQFNWHGHENSLNWQYTAAFAEQGKHKEVASYFDGSLRNRQSVTLNNSQKKAIIGETIYDFEGRPAVTTLPAPIDSGKIIYYNKYNLDPMDSEYNRKDFDTGTCAYIPVGMDSLKGDTANTTRGSSGYYSSANPDTLTGFDRFLPDAQGYPFVMTEYTPDITGRISRQSIAGKTHRLGSGHETKYFYGIPAQQELDRLFGSEVGFDSSYMKNMVIDANGQISVSYMDENGKTIATALAGLLPSNMKPIGSYSSASTLYANLLGGGSSHPTNSSKVSGYSLIATNAGDYHFAYQLLPGNYTDTSCSSAHVCTDCLYDVQLMITNSCGCDSAIILHYDSNFSYANAFDSLCGHQNILDSFTVYLQPGEYNVTRLISVDPKAISFYTGEFERHAACIKSYSTYLANAIANTNFSGCNMTCASCLSALGTQSAFVHNYITELHTAGEAVSTHQDTLNANAAFYTAQSQCNLLCQTPSPCTGLYSEMLADVTLGGQYCTYTQSGSTYSPGDASSVLNSTYYQYPVTPYLNSAGTNDSVVINGLKYLPQQLSLSEFIQNWKPSWASSLVGYHPEYCFYTRCMDDSSSNTYDYNMINTSTYTAAASAGYLNPLGKGPFYNCSTVISNPDPYFKRGGYGQVDSTWMRNRLKYYATVGGITLNLWEMVALAINRNQDTLQGINMTFTISATDTVLCGLCAGGENMAWDMFKGIYSSLKQHAQDSLDSIYVSTGCSIYANCVGLNTGGCASTIYDSKTPRHFSSEYVNTKNIGSSALTIAAQQHYFDSAMTVHCDSTCLSYAYYWYQQLGNCGAISSIDSTRLMEGFLDVCEAGCNINHPMGSSTTPYSQPDDSGDISFEDVIHRVLGVKYSDTLCNGTTINMPPPYYDSNGVTGPPVTYYKPTPCQCGNIDTAYALYSRDSASDHTKYPNFGEFLSKYYGDSISPANAYALRTLCRGSCFYATTPLQMPLWMSCCQDSDKPQQVTAAGGLWNSREALDSPTITRIYSAAAFSIADSGYVVGGDSSYRTISSLWRWEQSTNRWVQRASDVTREAGIGFAINGKGYTGLGFNRNTRTFLKDLRQYNPSTNTWSGMAAFPGASRNNAFSFVIGDTAYVGGGDSAHADTSIFSFEQNVSPITCYNSVWKYDPSSNTWTARASFPGGTRTGMVSFSIGGYGYAGCGMDGSGNLYNDMYRFNPDSNKWLKIAPLPYASGLFGSVSFTVNGKGYVGTGYNGKGPYYSSSYIRNFWAYDPTVNKWYTVTPFLGTGRALGVGFSIGNYGYTGTGAIEFDNEAPHTMYAGFEQLSIQDSAQFANPQCCISCVNIDTAIVHFGKAYKDVSDTSPNYTNLLSTYLNQYFGFDMTYMEYSQFYQQCASGDSLTLGDGKHLALLLCNRAANEVPPPTDTNTCYTQLMEDAQYTATEEYNTYMDSVQNAFEANYIAHCMNIDDSFHVTEPFDLYHYTLYYYDQAGNLVKTVPPQGVHPITLTTTVQNNINTFRNSGEVSGSPTYPVDSFQTHYFYNTLNEPIKQQTPDGDSVHYWYDLAGRICLSQNALQRPLLYSYTQFDALGRVNEVGQVSTVPQSLPSCFHCVGCTIAYGVLPVLPDTFTRKAAELQNFINTGTKTQVTHTYYDSITYGSIPLAQQNLRKRIASITYEEVSDNNIKTYDNAIHYTYDIEGNVASILIDVPHDSVVKQHYKRINYYYDLVSGNVNELAYEQDSIDQFIHNYVYDDDNRLQEVNTSHDSLFWEQDADYEYYDHGALAREVIGRRQVQGLDYMYTLNGWLKGINSSVLNPSYDAGGDGDVHGANATIARDAYGFTLNYFNGDYRSIAKTNFQATGLPITSLYNGNIAGATYSIKPLMPKTLGYTYNYDQLNRYVGDSVFKGLDTVNNTWTTRTGINDLKEKVSYDENGNILLYLRHGNTAVGPLAMDSMTYHYTKGRNQLTQVNDAVGATNYTVDIDNETSGRNYQYNKIGELAKDSAGGLDTIIWNVYGKVKEIKKHNGDSIILFYDPMSNRLEKRFYPHSSTPDTTIYVREGRGKTLAVYDRKKDTVRLTEWDMYGSKRLGSVDTILRLQKATVGYGTIDSITYSYLEGQKQYELMNHLGNVMATVSDKKISVDTVSTDTLAKYYMPLVINAQDYYPYGMVQPGRSYLLTGDSSYRYAFNDKEKTNEIYGATNAYDYGMRFYDPRLGRFFSIDPLASKFPYYSPYMYASDKPIEATDMDGLEAVYYMNSFLDANGQAAMDLLTSTDIGFQWWVQFSSVSPMPSDYPLPYFGNIGSDVFITVDQQISGEGGETQDFSARKPYPLAITDEQGTHTEISSMRKSILQARLEYAKGEKDGVNYIFWAQRLGDEVLMSDQLLSTINQNRDIILVKINPKYAYNAFGFTSLFQVMVYDLGHELLAHVFPFSGGYQYASNADAANKQHDFFNQIGGELTIIGPNSPADRLGLELMNVFKVHDKPIMNPMNKKTIQNNDSPDKGSHQDPRTMQMIPNQ
ncbi:MAG TPA: kelch repeat-containing protein [Bacteroidia bacterium]|jgi:RHS repeat-associated protein|nr:kelch repeat-containing protein [Bacteroidia bacterium]